MRTIASALAAVSLLAHAAAQCPDYSNGVATAAIGKFNGGDEARLIYVDCLGSIAFIEAQFGRPGETVPIDGSPLTLAIYDDPTDDMDPNDAVLVSMMAVPGGVTGGHTGVWQRYDVAALFGNVIPATGGMFVAVGVTYGAGARPGSIQFASNFPGTQWFASDLAGTLDYSTLANNQLRDLQFGPGFPPGTWIVRAESGPEFRTLGVGCNGSNGVPTIMGSAVTPPVLGQAIVTDLTNLPLSGSALALGVGFAKLPAPVDLGLIGMTGCTLYLDLLTTVPLTSAAGTSTWALVLSSDPTFAGRSLYLQALVIDIGANPLGVTTSNGLQAVLGL